MDSAGSAVAKYKIALSAPARAGIFTVGILFVFFVGIAFVAPRPLNVALGIFLPVFAIIFVLAIGKQRKNNYLDVYGDGSIMACNSLGPIQDMPDNCMRFQSKHACFRTLRDNIVSASLPTEAERALVHEWSAERLLTINSFQKSRYAMQFLRSARTREIEKGFGRFSVAFVSDENSLVKLMLKRLLVKNDAEEYTIEEPRIFLSVRDRESFMHALNNRDAMSDRPAS